MKGGFQVLKSVPFQLIQGMQLSLSRVLVSTLAGVRNDCTLIPRQKAIAECVVGIK